MKTLSLKQPWLWAILHAGKRIENRVWNTKYRGPILLHAAKGCSRSWYEWSRDWLESAGVLTEPLPPIEAMDRGGICARARLVSVIHPRSPLLPIESQYAPYGVYESGAWRWHMPEQYGFVLADVEPLPFHPCAGKRLLYDFDYAA